MTEFDDILSLAPRAGWVRLSSGGETWSVPLVGFAVVKRTRVPPDSHPEQHSIETVIEAVILSDDSSPLTLSQFRSSSPDLRFTHEIELT